MYTMAITNQKGGVGKTSTTINVGAALAELGKRVLLIDMDPSGDLTTHAGIDLEDGDNTSFEVLTEDVPIMEAVKTVHREETNTSYDVLPADSALGDLADVLHGQTSRQKRLKSALDKVADAYDYVLIDTPPSVGLQIVNAMVAADSVIVPAQPHYLSLTAINAVSDTIQDVRDAGLNKQLSINGIVMTNFDSRSRHHKDVAASIENALPGKPFKTSISNGIAVTEAAANRTDLFAYVAVAPARRRSKGVEQYRNLAAEIVERTENGRSDA